jgi:Zn-dependent protease with chaperone function
MFLPFLPFILALSALTALIALPDAPAPKMELWQAAVAFLALPLIGFLLGHLPARVPGRQGPMRFSLRRVMLLGLWLSVVSGLNLYHELLHAAAAFFAVAALPLAGDVVLTLLLANYWLCDGLAWRPFNPLAPAGAPEGWAALRSSLAIPLPALLLFIIGNGLTSLLDRLWPAGSAAGSWFALGQTPALLLIYGAMLAVVVPALIRLCWRLRPLGATGPASHIRSELEANGVRGTPVYEWPEGTLGATTAAIIGMVRPFRFMLIGPSLLAALSPEELRSVTAHEAAHVRQRHLWYYLAAILTFVLLMQIVSALLVVGMFLTGGSLPIWAGGIVEIVALLFFLRFGFGLLSRHFERQADIHAFRRHGLPALEMALGKVAALNGVPVGLDNWHHYGIGRRVAYLQAGAGAPAELAAHDRRVVWLKGAIVLALLVMVAAQPFLASVGKLPDFARDYLARRLERVREPGEAELRAAQYLAASSFEKGDLPRAEHYFRMILTWRPDLPDAQNNLAWLLVTKPEPSSHELREGLSLAERASEARQAAFIWDTLAEAYGKNGQPMKAEAAADMALRLAEGGQETGGESVEYYRTRLQKFTEARHQSQGG